MALRRGLVGELAAAFAAAADMQTGGGGALATLHAEVLRALRAGARAAVKPKGGAVLDAEQVARFREQVLLVLADYQSMKRDAHAFSRHEGVRLEVADRVVRNLLAVFETGRAGNPRARGKGRVT